MEEILDCIVVGAGPAGAAAALQMARDGLEVALLERGTQPGEKNVMSGVLIPHKLHDLVPDFEARAPLQRRITQGYRDNVISADATLHLPALRLHNPEKLPRPPYTVFRSQFDAWFA
ncbi:MAG: FAD-dependent oxidoreductase, partial [Delftia sp.]|nr:FAD-dependent oxidoreductase [Delftia sp.]